MKKQQLLYLLLLFSLALHAQESQVTYEKAIALIKSSKNSPAQVFDVTAGAYTLSFKNQAYGFWLDGMTSRFGNEDFENFYGDFLYEPIKIEAFKKAQDRRRSKYQLYVTETVDNLFVIELLSRKRKRNAKYPAFYQGASTSFLFEKTDNGDVRLVHSLSIQNN